MSSAGCQLIHFQLLCSVCQDAFTDPVAFPCGHNFYNSCDAQSWDVNAHCRFPDCGEVLSSGPGHLEDRGSVKTVQTLRSLCHRDRMCVCMLSMNPEPKKLQELKRVQQHEVGLTLDPGSAHPYLVLSDDGKQVKHGGERKNLPDSPLRFDQCDCVLAKQSFSSGRFYFEVQVKGKTKWDLGVARESINRKGQIILFPKNGYWTIWLRNGNQYKALEDPSVPLSLKHRPEKVGVFVDYEQGLVSFYDVDTADLIYSFTGCDFTERLYPYFSPCLYDGGENSAPLVISPVSHRLNHRTSDREIHPHVFR